MDFNLMQAAEAVGEVCAKTQDVDEVARVAGNLASQVGKSGGITKSEATMLTAIAARHAKDGAAKAGLAPEEIEAAGNRATTAAALSTTLGQAFFDTGLPDVATEAKKFIAAELRKQ